MQVNENYLYEVLAKACNQNPIEVKQAEQNIQELEKQPGYCLTLLNIITNHSFNSSIRCMAGVCLKNAIDKFWRKTAPNSIIEEERQLLKSQFLNYLNEPELKIARQMSVVLGKIARFELPHNWPDLLTKLIQILNETSTCLTQDSLTNQELKSRNNLIHCRSLMALHQIIKSLSSKRLSNDRKVFEELSNNIIEMMIRFAFFYVEKCLLTMDGQPDQIMSDSGLKEHSFYLDQAILCIKILHKLLLHGFKDNVDTPALNQLVINLLQSFDNLITKYNMIVKSTHQTLSDYFKEKYEYLIVLYIQILNDFQETYPYNFINTCMCECLNMIMHMCFTPQGKSLSFSKLSINLMNFLKSILMCDKYKQRLIKLENPQAQSKQQKAIEIKNNYLTQDNLKQILGFLFNEYLLITQDELEMWHSEPEEFINEDGTATDSWKYNFRACAETLFQAFVHEYHDLVVPIVVELIHVYSKFDSNLENRSSDQTLCVNNEVYDHNLLLKEAAYNCGSISAWELVSHIDFDVWFFQSLLPEIKYNCNKLIKRRILILISNWVNIKLSSENRPLVYEIISQCLQANEDLVIRFQATTTLKAVMDDIHFEKEPYLPFLNLHFGLLCQLLKQVDSCDTKIKVLSVISFLIERVDIHIRPYSAQLADYLPFLWEESADYNMLRCSIVTTFHHLVKSFGAQSVRYHSFLIPVLHYSTDTNNPASVYLLEDGLELWNITVQNSLQMTNDMLKLFDNIKPLLDRDTDIWKLCLEIIDSYVILDAYQLLQFYGEFLVTKFSNLLNESIKLDALLRLMKSIGFIFEARANNIQIQLFEQFILKAINLALNSDVYPMIVAMCLSMLAKPVFEDCSQFFKIIEKCAIIRNSTPEKVLGDLLDSWIDKLDMIVQPERRKLTALSLMSLITINSNVILERFGAILNACETVMLDVLKEDNGIKYDCMIMSRDVENDDEEVDSEHEKRKRRLRLTDPVYSISIKDFCLQKLRECETVFGTDFFHQIMNNVDKSVVDKLNELLNS